MSLRTLRMPDVDGGKLLQEAVRYQMHRACPSAVLNRIAQGLQDWIEETPNSDDATFAMPLRAALVDMAREWRAKEEEEYSTTKEAES